MMSDKLARALVERMYEIDGKQESLADKYGLLWDAIIEETERHGFRFVVETERVHRNCTVIRVLD